jgi:hypothetical protein
MGPCKDGTIGNFKLEIGNWKVLRLAVHFAV